MLTEYGTLTVRNLTCRFTTKDDVKPYDIYGVTVGEVEVDLLTGQHQVSCLYIGVGCGVPTDWSASVELFISCCGLI
jgi:hypothetical protein